MQTGGLLEQTAGEDHCIRFENWMWLRELVAFSSSFRGLNESCCVKGTGFGLAAPNATVSGCCLNENMDCCRGSDVDPRKQCGRGQGGSVLFPVAQTVYCGKFLFSEQKLSLLSLWL